MLPGGYSFLAVVCAAKAGVQSLLLHSGCCDDARSNLLLCLHAFARYLAATKTAGQKSTCGNKTGFTGESLETRARHRHRRAYVNGVGPSFLSSEIIALVIKTHCVEVEEFRAATTQSTTCNRARVQLSEPAALLLYTKPVSYTHLTLPTTPYV